MTALLLLAVLAALCGVAIVVNLAGHGGTVAVGEAKPGEEVNPRGGEKGGGAPAAWSDGSVHGAATAPRARSSTSGLCGSHEHLGWATRHVDRMELLQRGVTYSAQEVKDSWDETQRNRDTKYKFMLMQVKGGVVSLVGPLPLTDDFSEMCLHSLIETLKLVMQEHPLPDMLFIFSSIASLEQAPHLREKLHVPVFAACVGSATPMPHLWFPRTTHVLNPRRFKAPVAEFVHKEPRVFFRGALSGPERVTLFKRYSDRERYTDIKMTKVPAGAPCDASRKKWCPGAPKRWVEQEGLHMNSSHYMPLDASVQRYKYLLSVDGVGCADRLPQLMSSNSVVFMADSDFHEFWYADLVAGEHFVMVKGDFSDLEDKVKWAIANEEKMMRIIEQANQYVETYLTREGFMCFYKVMLSRYSLLFSGGTAEGLSDGKSLAAT